MKQIKTLHLCLFLLSIINLTMYGQQNTDSLLNTFQKMFETHPNELIYIQTNKDIYEVGEDLWFKSYQLNSHTFKLSGKSQTLYLQMIDFNDSVVWQEKYPIMSGRVHGHIYIDTHLSEGTYYLQGYTSCSFYQNDSLSIITPRKIKIVKNISHISADECLKDTSYNFYLLPEGGHLISGISNKLAFKATDKQGNPVEIKGTLYQDNEKIGSFQTIHYGMGTISFTPVLGKEYKILLNNGNSYTLPRIQPKGINLSLVKQNEKNAVFIIRKCKDIASQRIYLLGHMRGEIYCMAKGQLKDSLQINIPLENFPFQGIAEFTLFDENLHPLAERLVYVHPEKKLYISATPNKSIFNIREKGIVKFKVQDENGRPVQADLCLSIYDQVYHDETNPINILTHCYLSSQIRGKIYDPSYYFNENNADRLEALDLLLLTQGWRQYVWKVEENPCQGEVSLSDYISGRVVEKKKSTKNNSEQLVLVSGAEGGSIFIWTDNTGKFIVDTAEMLNFRGGYIYLKPMQSENKLEITDYFSIIDTIRKSQKVYYPIDRKNVKKEALLTIPIISKDSTILLDEVMITGKENKPFRDKFMGRLDSLAQINMNGPYICECGFLQNYMPEYDAHPYWAKNACSPEKRTKPIEGKSYELVKLKHLEGDAFAVIEYRTIEYHGPKYTEEELLKMNNLWKTKGYYVQREFYQPNEIDMQLSTPDARNALLWIPSVITDEKGEAEVSFYCSDINASFIGVIEGIDSNGLLGNKIFEIRVLR